MPDIRRFRSGATGDRPSAARLAEIEARPGAGQAAAAGAPRPARPPGPRRRRVATERVGLVLPTSMCSSQIARLAAERLNASDRPRHGIDRFVALTHTEGCGFGGGSMYDMLQRTYRGYVTHPNVAAALLLEHGCEKIPNDAMRRQFESAGLPLDRFGWASVQLDGGIENVSANVARWFDGQPPAAPATDPALVRLGALTIGVLSAAPPEPAMAAALAALVNAVLADGGTVLVPEGDFLIADGGFRRDVLGDVAPRATLAYGEPVAPPASTGRDRHGSLGRERHRPGRVRRAPRDRRGRRRAAARASVDPGAPGRGSGRRGRLSDRDIDLVAGTDAAATGGAAAPAGAFDRLPGSHAGLRRWRLRRVAAHPRPARRLDIASDGRPAARAARPGVDAGRQAPAVRGWSATACPASIGPRPPGRAGRPGPTRAGGPGRRRPASPV